MRLPDDAEVSDDIWDDLIDAMKVRVQDKIPAIRSFAVRALSRFAGDGEDGGIVDLFLETLDNEQNAVSQIILNNSQLLISDFLFHLIVGVVSFLKEVRKTIVLSLPPSNATLESVIESTHDVSELVRRAAYSVLSTKFPLQSLR